MTLRVRLSLIVLSLFLIGVLSSIMNSVSTARDQVQREIDSTSILISKHISLLLSVYNEESASGRSLELLNELIILEDARHIDISVESSQNGSPEFYDELNTDADDALNAPAWFALLLDIEDEENVQSFEFENGDVLIVRIDSSDELMEIWGELISTIILRFVALSIFCGLLFYFIGRWLRPARTIVNVLEEVEKGDFSRKVPTLSLPELNVIGERVNRLTSVLGASRSENERLTRKSLNIQEQERYRLAQELHDSLGQSVSAIKAIAASIAQRTHKNDPQSMASAESIVQVAEEAYQSVRTMMTDLRPVVLDELGLEPALKQMVDDWNDYHEDTFCRLSINNDFEHLDEDQQINVFRIVQEALTNIAKHAEAEKADVILSGLGVITLQIRDDGKGFIPEETTMGMGLMGINDRVNSLHGEITFSSRLRRGTSYQIEFPRVNSNRRRMNDRHS